MKTLRTKGASGRLGEFLRRSPLTGTESALRRAADRPGGGASVANLPEGVPCMADRLHRWRDEHRAELAAETERLTRAAIGLGAQQVVLFGSVARGQAGLTSDLDLLIVWDTSLDFVERSAEVYRRLQPTVAADLLVYTPAEMTRLQGQPFLRRALAEGQVLYAA
ncbi:MAG: nucleotidyltransferase domain-containing protein [Candidatus Latescibacterota bacterium]